MTGRVGGAPQKPWTNVEVQRLALMRQEGQSLRQIAVELGRTYRSVRGKSDYLGLAGEVR